MRETGIVAGVFLMAIGAILAFVISSSSSMIDGASLGTALFIFGLLSLGIALMLSEDLSWFGDHSYAPHTYQPEQPFKAAAVEKTPSEHDESRDGHRPATRRHERSGRPQRS